MNGLLRPKGLRCGAAVLALYLAGFLACLCFAPPGLPERDGYYHARCAAQFLERGLAREFPWTQASVWRERYCDKEFLYHALMAPFAWDKAEPIHGALVFTWLLGVAILAALYLLLRAQKVPRPLLLVFLLTCVGGPFLIRMVMVRSHVLSILLLLISMHFLLRGQWLAAGIVGFVYSWSYTAPVVLVMTAVPVALGRWLGGGGLDWRTPTAALVGVVLGLVIHPFAPLTWENFLVTTRNMEISFHGGGAAPLGLGIENNPYSTRAFLQAYPFVIGSLAVAVAAGWRLGRRAAPETLGALAAALLWLVMTAAYSRFIEYCAPLLIVALALLVRDAAPEWDALRTWFESRRWLRVAVLAGVVALALALHLRSAKHLLDASRGSDPPRFRGAAAWMAQHLEPGETVVNLAWDDFPDLFYDGWRQHYIWGLDPTFTERYDSEIAQRLDGMVRGRKPIDRAWLAQTFGARYMILRRAAARSFPQLTKGDWKAVYADDYAAVFPLAGEPSR